MFHFLLYQVGWDLWDQHVITAVNDNTLKVWEAATGNLSLVLCVSISIVKKLKSIVAPSFEDTVWCRNAKVRVWL